jgi:hypothetical protein
LGITRASPAYGRSVIPPIIGKWSVRRGCRHALEAFHAAFAVVTAKDNKPDQTGDSTAKDLAEDELDSARAKNSFHDTAKDKKPDQTRDNTVKDDTAKEDTAKEELVSAKDSVQG